MVTLSMRFDIDLVAMETKHLSRVEAISVRTVTWNTAARIVRTAVFNWIVVVRAMRSSRKAPHGWLLAAKDQVVTCPMA